MSLASLQCVSVCVDRAWNEKSCMTGLLLGFLFGKIVSRVPRQQAHHDKSLKANPCLQEKLVIVCRRQMSADSFYKKLHLDDYLTFLDNTRIYHATIKFS